MRKILIVEDDKVLNKTLAYNLTADGYEVTSAYSFLDSVERLKESEFDIALLDINLPDGNGLHLCDEIRGRGQHTYIMFITANDKEGDMLKGYEAGCTDYITKPFNILEVKARMKAILRRNAVTEKKAAKNNIINAGDMKIDCDSRNLYIAGRPINLTAKEFDLLELLAVNPGKVYSRDNLLKAVWGQDYSGDGRTVDVHMRRLREKIEDNPSEPKYVHTKWGVGYYFNV